MRGTPAERLWARVKKKRNGCWEWNGARSPSGHGSMRLGKGHISTHRLSFELAYGPIPSRMFICHRCDNPPCVNPEHLFLGTPADNMRDRDSKGRGATGRRNGRHTKPECTARGEQCGRTKLTTRQVLDIREAYANERISMRALGAIYGISHTQVRYVVRGLSWAHLS